MSLTSGLKAIKMYGGIPLFTVFCLILIVCDTAVHVMIQMYFEGHPAFSDHKTSGEFYEFF